MVRVIYREEPHMQVNVSVVGATNVQRRAIRMLMDRCTGAGKKRVTGVTRMRPDEFIARVTFILPHAPIRINGRESN